MGLSTHVLDTARGVPAAGIPVRVLDGGSGAEVAAGVTDADGRARLLDDGELEAAVYELRFDVAAHLGPDPGFLDVVPVRFRVLDPGRHHHVPLLLAPWAYSTYRGS
jgi:5-hydroxyisourate hydrolase